jgi:hypothetical protein
MNSFDFLRRLYISAPSAVVITNSINSVFWTKNLDKIGITADDMTGDNVYKYFKTRVNKLHSGEGIVSINGFGYHYNVKCVTEKSGHDYIVLEIITEPISRAFINDDNVANWMLDLRHGFENGSGEISKVVKTRCNNVSLEDKGFIDEAILDMLKNTLPLTLVTDMKGEIHNKQPESCSLSNLLVKFAETCQAVFRNINIDIEVNCVEDIYGHIGETSFFNACIATLSRTLCSCRGMVDKIVFSLELLTTGITEIGVSVQSPSGEVRISNADDLKKKLLLGNALGTDLFTIRYFCGELGGSASERIDRINNETRVILKIPNCESQGVMLFKCKNQNNIKNLPTTIYDNYGIITPYSKIVVGLRDILPNLK